MRQYRPQGVVLDEGYRAVDEAVNAITPVAGSVMRCARAIAARSVSLARARVRAPPAPDAAGPGVLQGAQLVDQLADEPRWQSRGLAARRDLQLAQGRQLHAQAARLASPVVQIVHLAAGHRLRLRACLAPLRACHGVAQVAGFQPLPRQLSQVLGLAVGLGLAAHEAGVFAQGCGQHLLVAPRQCRQQGLPVLPFTGVGGFACQKARHILHHLPVAQGGQVAGHGPQFVVDRVHRLFAQRVAHQREQRAQPAQALARFVHASSAASRAARSPVRRDATRWLIGRTHGGRTPVYDCGTPPAPDEGGGTRAVRRRRWTWRRTSEKV